MCSIFTLNFLDFFKLKFRLFLKRLFLKEYYG